MTNTRSTFHRSPKGAPMRTATNTLQRRWWMQGLGVVLWSNIGDHVRRAWRAELVNTPGCTRSNMPTWNSRSSLADRCRRSWRSESSQCRSGIVGGCSHQFPSVTLFSFSFSDDSYWDAFSKVSSQSAKPRSGEIPIGKPSELSDGCRETSSIGCACRNKHKDKTVVKSLVFSQAIT